MSGIASTYELNIASAQKRNATDARHIWSIPFLYGVNMEHHFNIDIASEYGMLEAVILNNLWFWIIHNKANDKNYHNGRYWTYNSVKALKELFPYATDKKIRNALKHLEEEEIIITGNYNASAYDRTTWYALTDKGESIMQKGQMHLPKRANGSTQKGKPIPDNKPNNKTDINTYVTDFCGDDLELTNAVNDFLAMRKAIKKPITTERAIKMLFKRLQDLSPDAQTQIAILNQSVFHNWQNVYDLKQDKGETKNTKIHNFTERKTDYSEIEKLIYNR